MHILMQEILNDEYILNKTFTPSPRLSYSKLSYIEISLLPPTAVSHHVIHHSSTTKQTPSSHP